MFAQGPNPSFSFYWGLLFNLVFWDRSFDDFDFDQCLTIRFSKMNRQKIRLVSAIDEL